MQDLWLLPAGVIAGIINAVAGGGSLVTFPVFLSLGYSPYDANITNSCGIFASNIGAVWGYRRELRKNLRLVTGLCSAGVIGATLGAMLFLHGGAESFESAVVWCVIAGSLLVLVRPMFSRFLQQRGAWTTDRTERLRFAAIGTALIAIYGGYFGAAMGVLLLGVLGVTLHGSLQRSNALKNAVALFVNATDFVLYAALTSVRWPAVALMTIGTLTGGVLGAHVARRLPEKALRLVVVCVGLGAALSIAL